MSDVIIFGAPSIFTASPNAKAEMVIRLYTHEKKDVTAISRELNIPRSTIYNILRNSQTQMINRAKRHALTLSDYERLYGDGKICLLCGEYKKREEYYGHYGSYCKECDKTRRKYEQLSEKYGLSQEEYITLIKKQDGKCAVCHKEMERFCVDHDHDNNIVRGLVHISCNVAIGYYEKFKMDKDLYNNIETYLNNTGEKTV